MHIYVCICQYKEDVLAYEHIFVNNNKTSRVTTESYDEMLLTFARRFQFAFNIRRVESCIYFSSSVNGYNTIRKYNNERGLIYFSSLNN